MVPEVMQVGEAGAQNGLVAVDEGKVETDAAGRLVRCDRQSKCGVKRRGVNNDPPTYTFSLRVVEMKNQTLINSRV